MSIFRLTLNPEEVTDPQSYPPFGLYFSQTLALKFPCATGALDETQYNSNTKENVLVIHQLQ